MTWGLVLIVVPVFIAWRRPRVDGRAVLALVVVMAGVLAYTYRTLGA